jgi:hypothetical protein
MQFQNSIRGLHREKARELYVGTLAGERPRNVGIIILLALHIPLAISMRYFNEVSTLHAIATVAIGLAWLAAGEPLTRAMYVAAYITGSEVLWRMTGASVFWEFGKYATAVVLIVGLLRGGRLRGSLLPILYFALLLPSALFTFDQLNLDEARKQFSFNMSGPLALMVCVLFFSQMRISSQQMRNVFVGIIAPIVGVASLTLFRLITVTNLEFSERRSSFSVAGFGPNQVSAALSLGAVLALLYILSFRSDWFMKVVMCTVAIILLSQSALTFSRGGLYMAAGSLAAGSLYFVRNTRNRIKLALVLVLLATSANFVILPRLDAITNHAVEGRFANTYESGREEIVLNEMKLWRDNIFLGVGPGVSMSLSKNALNGIVPPHTEFTRILVEHGLPGVLALMFLFTMAMVSVRRQNAQKSRAIAVTILTWSFLFMAINAMRIVAPSFLFGLAALTWITEGSEDYDFGKSQLAGRNNKLGARPQLSAVLTTASHS